MIFTQLLAVAAFGIAAVSAGTWQCQTGYSRWYQHCFKKESSRTWSNCMSRCENIGGHMATPKSSGENTKIDQVANGKCWIGIHDKAEEGKFIYLDTGKEITFTRWAGGEPNNVNSWPGEDCVEMYTDGKWNDLNCDSGYRVCVCEKDATYDACDPYPCNADGTTSCNSVGTTGFSCTCKPGFSGTTCSDRCPAGFTRVGDDCYRKETGEMTWTQCDAACTGRSAHIATPKTQAQNDYVKLRGYGWIGISDRLTEGTFRWEDDQTLLKAYNFENWSPGEPNDAGQDGEDCAHMYDSGKWNDLKCHGTHKVNCLCQTPAAGCPAGYTERGSKCYKIMPDKKTEAECHESCGAFLPTLPRNLAENNVVKEHYAQCWLWSYSDGSSPPFSL